MNEELSNEIKNEVKGIVSCIAEDLVFDEHRNSTHREVAINLEENIEIDNIKTIESANEYIDTLTIVALDPNDLTTLESTLKLIKGGQELFDTLFK